MSGGASIEIEGLANISLQTIRKQTTQKNLYSNSGRKLSSSTESNGASGNQFRKILCIFNFYLGKE